MDRYIISEITAAIRDGKSQKVFLHLEDFPDYIQMDYLSLHQILPRIGITEIELLHGCFLYIEYYKRGEQRTDGSVITDQTSIKSLKFKLDGTLDECRKRNIDRMLLFEKISEIAIKKSQFDEASLYAEVKTFQGHVYNQTLKNLGIQNVLKAIGVSAEDIKESEIFLPALAYISPEVEVTSGKKVFIKDWNLRLALSPGIEKTIPNKPIPIRRSGNCDRSDTGYSDYETYNRSSDYEVHGGPSDGYGGYLTDDYIDDALGGDPSAYSID